MWQLLHAVTKAEILTSPFYVYLNTTKYVKLSKADRAEIKGARSLKSF
jgi:hypothetical protein